VLYVFFFFWLLLLLLISIRQTALLLNERIHRLQTSRSLSLPCVLALSGISMSFRTAGTSAARTLSSMNGCVLRDYVHIACHFFLSNPASLTTVCFDVLSGGRGPSLWAGGGAVSAVPRGMGRLRR
jgi:hypothetical protein